MGKHEVSLDPYPEDLPSQTDFLDDPEGFDDEDYVALVHDLQRELPEAEVAANGDAALSTPIYGGEGYGDVKRRNLLVLIAMPVYLRDKEHPERGIDHQLTAMMLHSDVKEAMLKAIRKLNDTAAKYRVTGYSWSDDDVHFDVQGRTIIATLVIERE